MHKMDISERDSLKVIDLKTRYNTVFDSLDKGVLGKDKIMQAQKINVLNFYRALIELEINR